jgi:hypothetical protein
LKGGSVSGGNKNEPEPPVQLDCRRLNGTVFLDSVVREALNEVGAGDILRVELESYDGPILALTDSDRVVGSIASGSLAEQLRRCLRQGFGYSAEVVEIDGGWCKVRVGAT